MSGRSRVMLVIAVVSALAGAVPGARADYHPACAGIVTGMDSMDLIVGGDEIIFEGEVTCPGAQRITVDVVLSGAGTGSAAAACEDLVACLQPVTARGTVPHAAGTYRIDMEFSVEGAGALLSYHPIPRCGVWVLEGETLSGPFACPR